MSYGKIILIIAIILIMLILIDAFRRNKRKKFNKFHKMDKKLSFSEEILNKIKKDVNNKETTINENYDDYEYYQNNFPVFEETGTLLLYIKAPRKYKYDSKLISEELLKLNLQFDEENLVFNYLTDDSDVLLTISFDLDQEEIDIIKIKADLKQLSQYYDLIPCLETIISISEELADNLSGTLLNEHRRVLSNNDIETLKTKLPKINETDINLE